MCIRDRHQAGLPSADRGGIDQLEVDGRKRSGDAGEKAREREGDEAHRLRIIADELRPFGVLAHRIAHAAERRTPQRKHRYHAQQAPKGD